MEVEIVRVRGSVDDVSLVLKQLGTNLSANTTMEAAEPNARVSTWDQAYADTFMRNIDANPNGLREILDMVKDHAGIAGQQLLRAVRMSTMKQLAGKLSAITKLAHHGGRKDARAIVSEWIGGDYHYSIDPGLVPYL